MAFDRDEWMRRLGPLYPALVAVKCVTRLPVAATLVPAGDDLARSAKWFTAVAGAVGLTLAAVAGVLGWLGLVPALIASVVALAAVLAHRGLYEGGLARTIDALWTGSTHADLDDEPRTGAFGATAITAVIGLRALGLMGTEATPWTWLGAIVVSQMLARWSALFLAKIGDHLEHPVPARTPLLVGDATWESLAFAGAIAGVCTLVFTGLLGLLLVMATPVIAAGLGLWIQRRFGGFTSETLAATSAVCELAVLLLFAAIHPAVTSPFV